MFKKASLVLVLFYGIFSLNASEMLQEASGANWVQVAVLSQAGLNAANFAYEPQISSGLTSGRAVVTCASDGTAKLWEAFTGKLQRTFKHPANVSDARFSPDNRVIGTTADDHQVRFWNVTTGQIVSTINTSDLILYCSIAFSADGGKVGLGGAAPNNGRGDIFDVKSGKRVDGLGAPGSTHAVDLNPNNSSMLVIASENNSALAVEFGGTSGIEHIWKFDHQGPVYDARFSPDGGSAATASADSTAVIWGLYPFSRLQTLSHKGPVRSVYWSDTSKKVLTASDDGTVVEWDAATGEQLTVLPQSSSPVSARYMPGGSGEQFPTQPYLTGMVVAFANRAVVYSNPAQHKKVEEESIAESDGISKPSCCSCTTTTAQKALKAAVGLWHWCVSTGEESN